MFFWGATKRYVMEKKATFVNFLFHNVHSQHKKVSLSSVLLCFFRKPFERCFWFWKPIFEQTGGDILEGRISTQFCTVFLERMRWEDKHTVGKNVLKKVSFFVLKNEPKKKKQIRKNETFLANFQTLYNPHFFQWYESKWSREYFQKGCWTTKKKIFFEEYKTSETFKVLENFCPFIHQPWNFHQSRGLGINF